MRGMADPLGFLISDLARLMRRRFDERARAIGVTRPQWRTLTLLSRHEGINQGGLAEMLEVEPITLCRMIDRLEEAGLVERRRDPADRRAWRIFLTDAAKPVLQQLRALADDMYETVLAGVSSGERGELTRLLTIIRTNLSATDYEPEIANG
jgi:DNA-binding MarR family transcriptional regulator